ncbi:carboxylating nicotinate-nucleotide diphosphorylase [Legionella londiniensis]|uniref:Probable nicotinate-nucleotide pyrophosphorylase [carboxylating] n=2 Tax=Legionella londiniensis TaxID=45068 RepID=A0A0W0VQU9_9GAMM|nr:carboxylating nicotinate-nucleotide diphosphorylase [Legionella londiniensis]KTD22383.1 nicotinate-nucleotide pyrophosphorylase [Legionella londiniensis]STX93043.1 nicotinate-nucleotide pyrophosphorylase [Legionella londiniensis]
MLPEKKHIIAEIREALAEDIGTGDVTALLLPRELTVTAKIISREAMLICGIPWVEAVFAEIDPEIELSWQVREGCFLSEPTTLCLLRGNARSLLTAERTALNFMQMLSATATQTYRFLECLKGYKTRLLDTRKTLPGLRMAQKYAVACAGGLNHRFGLYDAFLIKENHIKACGSIKRAVAKAKEIRSDLLIEVEVETLEEFEEALSARPHRILLDNFSLDMIKKAVAMNQPKNCELEASGGIHLETVSQFAETGVDYISVGSITKSIKAIDLSLLVE